MPKRSVDVRSKKDVKDLENTIQIGPITIVLIYADWCGYCKQFMENVWKKLLMKQLKAKLASVHHDQLQYTSLRDAKFKGYPSVLVVGSDGQPASFPLSSMSKETTNAMPKTDLKTLETIAEADSTAILSGERSLEEEENSLEANTLTQNNVRGPPDARADKLMVGGNLFRILSEYSGLNKRRKTIKKKRSSKKTRRS